METQKLKKHIPFHVLFSELYYKQNFVPRKKDVSLADVNLPECIKILVNLGVVDKVEYHFDNGIIPASYSVKYKEEKESRFVTYEFFHENGGGPSGEVVENHPTVNDRFASNKPKKRLQYWNIDPHDSGLPLVVREKIEMITISCVDSVIYKTESSEAIASIIVKSKPSEKYRFGRSDFFYFESCDPVCAYFEAKHLQED